MPDPREQVGDLAIVLHSHMPYVEGFGTYPFGEEWLFDAVARSYLPVLAEARGVTVTVSPVLADQLEAPGVMERLEVFLRAYRLEAAERDAGDAPEDLRPAATAEAARYRRALDRLAELGGDALSAFSDAARERGVALIPTAASHAVLPLLATAAGRRLQIDAALRSHMRRFGPARGFWLPECAYRARHRAAPRRARPAVLLRRPERARAGAGVARPRPGRGRPGRVHDRLGDG